jgi:hypothetical protein
MGAYYGNLASLQISGPVWICPQGNMDEQYFNVVSATLHGHNGDSSIVYDIALAPGPNCIARPAGSSPPPNGSNNYNMSDPGSAQNNHYQLWIDDEPGKGDSDFNDIGFDVTVNGDGTVKVVTLKKDAGDSFDLNSAETGETLIANVGAGSAATVNVSGGRASYAFNGLSEYGKLIMKPDKIIALDYYSGTAKPGSDRESDWKRDKTGTPRFARHNRKVNILFSDYSVRLTDWYAIDFFRNPNCVKMLWDVSGPN